MSSRSDEYEQQLLAHVAQPQYDVPHETSYKVPHEIQESVKLTDDWLNLMEHNEGANHISDELRKNQMLHGEFTPFDHHEANHHKAKHEEPNHHESKHHAESNFHLMKKRNLKTQRFKETSLRFAGKKRHLANEKVVGKRSFATHHDYKSDRAHKNHHENSKRVLMDYYDEIQVEQKGKVQICFLV